MQKIVTLTTVLILVLFVAPFSVYAASDGTYSLFQIDSTWDGTDAMRTVSATSDYNYSYGDEESITYDLPWQFTLYGVSYSQITADTNGNIWFLATDAAHSYDLADTERGPVIAAWNNDLSSYYILVATKKDFATKKLLIKRNRTITILSWLRSKQHRNLINGSTG